MAYRLTDISDWPIYRLFFKYRISVSADCKYRISVKISRYAIPSHFIFGKGFRLEELKLKMLTMQQVPYYTLSECHSLMEFSNSFCAKFGAR